MDWARAKNILITLLFALNLMLAVSVVSRALGGVADRTLYEDVGRILDGRGVAVLCDFPTEIKSSGLLIYGDGTRFVENCANALSSAASANVVQSGRESLRYTNPRPDEALDVSSLPALDKSVRAALLGRGIDLAGFVTDYSVTTADGGAYFKYVLEYKGNLVFDSRLEVTVDGSGGISEVGVSYRDIKSVASDKRMKVMPAYQVILKNYNLGDAAAVTAITSIDIGFMGQNASRENPFIESEEGAVWRVRAEDGGERFFEAAYGDEISPAER